MQTIQSDRERISRVAGTFIIPAVSLITSTLVIIGVISVAGDRFPTPAAILALTGLAVYNLIYAYLLRTIHVVTGGFVVSGWGDESFIPIGAIKQVSGGWCGTTPGVVRVQLKPEYGLGRFFLFVPDGPMFVFSRHPLVHRIEKMMEKEANQALQTTPMTRSEI